MSPKYTLTYFEFTGLAESIRLLFKYGNIDFIDKRISEEEWPVLKNSTPMGQVPMLEVDGKVFHQHRAINRYVAKLVGLAGDDGLEAYEIDSAVDSIADVFEAIMGYIFEEDPEVKIKLERKLIEEDLPYLLPKLDKLVESNKGFFANSRLSWADFYFYSLFEKVLKTFMVGVVGEKYPNLQENIKKVSEIPAVSEWAKVMPENKFDPVRFYSPPQPEELLSK